MQREKNMKHRSKEKQKKNRYIQTHRNKMEHEISKAAEQKKGNWVTFF